VGLGGGLRHAPRLEPAATGLRAQVGLRSNGIVQFAVVADVDSVEVVRGDKYVQVGSATPAVATATAISAWGPGAERFGDERHRKTRSSVPVT